MALMGFRDTSAGALETFAATAERASLRPRFSEASRRPDRVHVAADVEKALLRGTIYAEMQGQGEAPRQANLTLPPISAAILRHAPVYDSFDERTECLRCIKPGTGCKDVPSAISMKLARATRSPECRAKPTRRDLELEIRHVTSSSCCWRLEAGAHAVHAR
eukprot:4711961-Pyramimonas_sp.AAC.1